MPKNLVLFSDGTGNSAAKLSKTNVWRVYQAVDLSDPQKPEIPRQFAFYDDGVGTSAFKPLALLGGAFGVGLARNVLDLYVFLCRVYEPGDRIYAFGFSRGAFTIRVLVGLVTCEGLLRYGGSEEELRRLSRDAYRAYRAKRFTSANPLVSALRRTRDAGLEWWNRMRGRTTYAQAKADPHMSVSEVPIEFLGLWDTVDAYGLPVDELTRAIDKFVWPLTMRDYNLSPLVQRACHALALDDERNTFHPRLWNEVPVDGTPGTGVVDANRHTRHIREERVSQVWFAGVHSNVGGGYPNDGLSYVSLQWMMREAEHHELRFEKTIWAEQQCLADENAPLYDSRHGVASYYRYNPRRIELLAPPPEDRTARAQVHESLLRRIGLLAPTPKVRIARTKVHESVLRRIQAGHDGYAPIALPPGFAVARIDGSIVDAEAYLAGLQPARIGTSAPAGSPDAAPPLLSAYAAGREQVFNAVWKRRVAYFLTLGLSLALVAMPLLAPGSSACEGRLCFVMKPITLLGLALPSFATTWTQSFASHPDIFVPLLAALMASMGWGTALEVAIRDRMRRVWYGVPPLRPSSVSRMGDPKRTGRLEAIIQKLRRHPLWQGCTRVVANRLMPTAFLAALVYAAVAAVLQLDFARQASTGVLCPDPAHGAVLTEGPAELWFDTRQPCASAGLSVREGATYRVRISVPSTTRWRDATLPAGPHGLECTPPVSKALVMAAAVPLRRHPTEPWFQPVARIGATGNDSYILQATPSTPAMEDRCPSDGAPRPATTPPGCPASARADPVVEVVDSVIVARSSGPLFFYVNDAVGLPFIGNPFYANNGGCARIEILLIAPARGTTPSSGL